MSQRPDQPFPQDLSGDVIAANRDLNDSTVAANLARRPEAPAPTANSPEFQPSPANIVGDMVADFLPDEPLNPGAEDTFPAQLGGSDVLVAGADGAPAPGPVSPKIRGLP